MMQASLCLFNRVIELLELTSYNEKNVANLLLPNLPHFIYKSLWFCGCKKDYQMFHS